MDKRDTQTVVETVKVQVEYFTLTTKDTAGTIVTLDIPISHNAEGILRGMVHSGMAVTIEEKKEVRELAIQEIKALHMKGYAIKQYEDISHYYEPRKRYRNSLNNSEPIMGADLAEVATHPEEVVYRG